MENKYNRVSYPTLSQLEVKGSVRFLVNRLTLWKLPLLSAHWLRHWILWV